MDDTVAAGRRLAGVAVIAWVLVAIIAALARCDDAIAAARHLASVAAQVCIDTIPIIAFFDADVHEGIAAASVLARAETGVLFNEVAGLKRALAEHAKTADQLVKLLQASNAKMDA